MVCWDESLIKLKCNHSGIKKQIPEGSVAYIDIPFHYNIGDLLIYLGTEEFLKKSNVKVNYRALQGKIENHSLNKCQTILVHGGGNFGDLYINAHRAREKVLLKQKDKKIIFLPQSIHFNSEVELKKTKSFFEQLSDVVLYVRDVESYNVGLKLTKNTFLMPDMAHSLHPLISENEIIEKKSGNKILNLIRKDKESSNNLDRISKKSFDWEDIIDGNDLLLQFFLKKASTLPLIRDFALRLWLRHINYKVVYAIHYVDCFDHVHTDRLHGYILALLLGKKITAYDNSYSKIERYRNAWFLK